MDRVGYAILSERDKQRFRLQRGDILFSHINSAVHVGKTGVFESDEPVYHGVNLLLMRPNESVTPAYLEYALKYLFQTGYWRGICKQSVNQASVNQEDVSRARISYPKSRAAQQRIVGLLDEAFAGIATAKGNAEKNLRNARALFASELNAIFAKDWSTHEIVPLSALATDITDGDHLPPPKAEFGIPFITIGNIVKNTRTIDFGDTFKVPQKYYDGLKGNRKPRVGDVLYTVTGSFGIPVIVRQDGFCFQRHIALVRPNSQTDTRWLYYLLLSPQVFAQAEARATGTAQKTVSLKVLRSYSVPRVPLNDQRTAVARLDRLTAETQRLESLYERKLAALDALKKSLLHQAFTGQLSHSPEQALATA